VKTPAGAIPGPVFGIPGGAPFFRGTDTATGMVRTDALGWVVEPFTNDFTVDAPDLLLPDFIPNGPQHHQSVRVLFEGAHDDPDAPGQPLLASATGFVSDVTLLNGRRFVRWRVEFDVAMLAGPAPPGTPLPQFNFLRVPVKY
jgi:hypothetical protein